MGLFSRLFGGRRLRRDDSSAIPPSHGQQPRGRKARICRFEDLEQRQLLTAAPIQLGAVYYENHDKTDMEPDRIEITWQGGAAGTQLKQLTIDTDKLGDGLSMADVFFDVGRETGKPGVYGFAPLVIVSQAGIDAVQWNLSADRSELTFTFSGFDAGEKLVFTVDVDEVGYEGYNLEAEGQEFQGSILAGVFDAPHYATATGSNRFRDYYDEKLSGSGLNLPPDSYMPPSTLDEAGYTCGAIFPLVQQPLPSSLSGTVFEDTDLDNVLDPGESGIGSVQLSLFRLENGQYVATGLVATTDAAGQYRFSNLDPGTYRVLESQPGGYFSIGARAGSVGGAVRGEVESADAIRGVELLGGEDSVRNDFAEALPAELRGFVYHDVNNNGVKDAGEAGIANATVLVHYLPATGALPAPLSITTGADGAWAATGLMPGSYKVTELTPQGYLDGLDKEGNAGGSAHNPGDLIDGIQLVSRQSGVEYNFGEILPSTLSGRVFVDMSGDCKYQPGEPLLAKVTLRLLDSNGNVVATTQTNDQGEYEFTNLYPGSYSVNEIQPEGYFDGCDSPGTAGGTRVPPDTIGGVNLVPGTNAQRYDFAERLPSSIRGRVSVDRNGNQSFEEGEPLLANVTLRLLNADGEVVATTRTNDQGEYAFTNLAPGVYKVEEIQPEGYFDGSDHVGSAGGTLAPPDSIAEIRLISDTHGTRYDFMELESTSLSGYVYEDDNNNGLRDAGEAPIAGVTLALTGGSTTRTTTTNADGYYLFDGLVPGLVYGVSETQPAAYFDGLDTAGNLGGRANNPGDSITEVRIAAGQSATDYNFGELRPASIQGKVYVDADQNGMIDGSDRLLSGVTVHLINLSGTRLRSTITDALGQYAFTGLVPGVYGVEEEQPAAYFDGKDYPGTAGGKTELEDRIQGAKLIAGAAATGYDFSEIPSASISGYVFQDGPAIQVPPGQPAPDPYTLRDGQFTADDKPLAGVVLKLANGNGELIRDANGNPITTTTDSRGYYQFIGLRPGQYAVIEEQPQGYIRGLNTPGSNGGLALNPNSDLDPVILSQLAVDPATTDALAMVPLRAGDAAVSYNFSEILMEEEPWGPPENPKTPDPLPLPPPWVGLPSPPKGMSFYNPSPTDEITIALHGGGGIAPISYSWHLSVINAGLPRRDQVGPDALASLRTTYFNPISWSGPDLNRSMFILADAEGKPTRQIVFGLEGARPLAGDWNGEGTTKVGIFFDGLWFLDLNGNGVWDSGDLWAQLGQAGDQPATGDWDGDGKTDIGILGPVWAGDGRALVAEPGLPDVRNQRVGRFKNLPPDPQDAPIGLRAMKRSSQGRIRSDLIDHVFQYGQEGDVPVTGDWNGDGIGNIGLYRNGIWYLDADGDGKWSDKDLYVDSFGQAGDVPVVGDWTGDGISKIGVYRKGTWYLDTNNNHLLDATDKVLQLGGPDDLPIVGDWTGEGVDKIGIYRHEAPKADQQAMNASRPEPAAPARK